ncbi:MAG: hypothetical protein WCL10_17610 [Novosphingobium sp.]|uniref:hypothetical protein n=1 Tax=Novosphingobium sp. TaxID=1874826 RepID=UPI0030194A36
MAKFKAESSFNINSLYYDLLDPRNSDVSAAGTLTADIDGITFPGSVGFNFANTDLGAIILGGADHNFNKIGSVTGTTIKAIVGLSSDVFGVAPRLPTNFLETRRSVFSTT